MARILIVDDDEPFRVMLRAMLEQAGYEVVEAREGREGLQWYQETPTDVILLDLFMPGREGLETINALRRVNPQVKIIAISGGGRIATGDYLDLAGLFGAQCTLQKPFLRQELLDAVRDVIQGK